MARYSSVHSMALIAADTVGNVRNNTGTAIRGRVYEWSISSATSPADAACNISIVRQSTAGTATAVTPRPLDPVDTAALLVASQNYTVEPTTGVTLGSWSLNQRATFRWVAAPNSELAMAASNNNGLGWLCNSTTASFTLNLTVMFVE